MAKLTEEVRAQIRELRNQGMTYPELSRRFCLSTGTVHRVVNSVPGAETVVHPVLNYSTAFLDRDWESMTELRRREYDQSVMRVFALQTEVRMTPERARTALSLSPAELMERECVDGEQAALIRRSAWEFLERLERGNMEGNK